MTRLTVSARVPVDVVDGWGYEPPTVFDRPTVRRLLLLQALKKTVEDGADAGDVMLEDDERGVLAEALFEYGTEFRGDREEIAASQGK